MGAPQDIIKSPEGRARMEAFYERFLARLPAPTERTSITTRHGSTNVLTFGPAEAPPLLVLHGALAGAPHALGELRGLLDRYRVVAPDIVGQSVASAPTRPAFDAAGFGGWAMDVLDAMKLERAHVLGVSWGGAVAMQLAQHAPDRVDRLALLVPAGLVSGSAWQGLTKVAWPMLRWKLRPTDANLRSMLAANFTTFEPLWTEFMAEALASVRIDFTAPPLATPEAFAGFTRPTMVVAAEHDVSFPGSALLERAALVFPNLVRTELLEGSKHCPPFDDEFRDWLASAVDAFLSDPLS
ncbi:MAG: alpha/beta hydrolase [Myxococcota bacterium]